MVKVAEERRRASALPAEERRTAIIRATLPLLLSDGEKVTTRQIAEAAGIAEGTIFRVFADKDEVIAAAIEAVVDPAPVEAALQELDQAAPLDVVLTQVVEILQRRTLEVWRLMSSVGPRFHDRAKPLAPSPALQAIFKAHRGDITLDPAAAARHLRALALAASHPLLTDAPMAPRKITLLFLHGAAQRPSC